MGCYGRTYQGCAMKCQNKLCGKSDSVEPSGCFYGAQVAAKCPKFGYQKRMIVKEDADMQQVAL